MSDIVDPINPDPPGPAAGAAVTSSPVPGTMPAGTRNVDWTNEVETAEAAPTLAPDPAFWGDKSFFRSVVYFAGWVLILSVGGMLLLAANDKPIPEGIVATAAGLVGLLTGVFASKGSR